MTRLLVSSAALVPLLFAPAAGAAESSPKEALQALNDFIGVWNGSGNAQVPKKEVWSETVNWSWRFKGDDAWLTMAVPDGKHIRGGELRYLPDAKRYRLTAQ